MNPHAFDVNEHCKPDGSSINLTVFSRPVPSDVLEHSRGVF